MSKKQKNQKKPCFNEHIKENKTLDWCDLAHKIMCLEDELFNLAPYLDNRSKNTYEKIIEDCESEKALRLGRQFNYSKHLQNQLETAFLSEEEE